MRPLPEISFDPGTAISDSHLLSDTPWVARGLVSDWPIVEAAQHSDERAVEYLKTFYAGRPVCAFLGEPKDAGRFFYQEGIEQFNFVKVDTSMAQVMDKLLTLRDDPMPPALYVGSTHLETWLPGFASQHEIAASLPDPLVSLWIGNRSLVSAHFDFPRNIACCVMGKRRFTVFPPEQVKNLYIGPWDNTPAGQPISLVDFDAPDLERFPKFADALPHALTVELNPGDAIYLPNMWWHQVESLTPLNGLINYWWQETPAVLGNPMDAFKHALLSIRSLPDSQRKALQSFFEFYVFQDGFEHLSHMPEDVWGQLGPIDDPKARQLRAELLNALKR